MFLSEQELREMTGRQKAKAQARWLQEQGFSFCMGADGRVKVLREAVLARLGGQSQTKPEPQLRLA